MAKFNVLEALAKMKQAQQNGHALVDKAGNKINMEADTLNKLNAAIALKEAEIAKRTITTSQPVQTVTLDPSQVKPVFFDPNNAVGMHGESITYEPEQLKAISLVAEGKSVCVIGPAGSGKTTTSRGALSALLSTFGNDVPMFGGSHKYIPNTAPPVAIVAFTKRAVNNIRKVAPKELKACCVTMHKLLEYQPVEKLNPDTGKMTKPFEPNRDANNPLPAGLRIVVIEEAGMLSVKLWNELISALPNPEEVQFIFLGDLYQLPPPIDSAILGFKLNELPTVELTKVRRTNVSYIIDFAYRIKDGHPLKTTKVKDGITRHKFPQFDNITTTTDGIIELIAWQQDAPMPAALNKAVAKQMFERFKQGKYDPTEDIILCPFESPHTKDDPTKELVSTTNINAHLADLLGHYRNAEVHEIVARSRRHYLAVGDKVLYEKEDAIITKIVPNSTYTGEPYREPSVDMTRHGIDRNTGDTSNSFVHSEFDVDTFLDNLSGRSLDENEEVTNDASHEVTIQFSDGYEVVLRTAGQLNSLMFGYAITVYKSQGSEWNRVFLITHKCHARQINNEMFYTAVTRAKVSVTIMCERDHLDVGITRRSIKGRTLAEKAEFFKGLAGTVKSKSVAELIANMKAS